ncbi:MAG TPA: DUF559 domain-containing protein [Candidatus Dormibacteraeota bacterium]|nr:DUF559 domain-containing protein [Candidatus Dormibacteraeota bacterium]
MLHRVSRTPIVPAGLMRGPFSLDEARRHGLAISHLRGASWRRLGPATYIWRDLADDPIHQLEAARRRLPSGAAFSGSTAAWLHGLDVTPCNPIEATVPTKAGVSARAGIVIRRCALAKDDLVRIRGFLATSIERTLADLCRRLSRTEGVVLVDAALQRRLTRLESVRSWTQAASGLHGIRFLRKVLEFAEPGVESPMESRLRMLLVLAGLPKPRVQVPIHDRWHRLIGRPDLYYDDACLGIEYDGRTHRDSLAEDNRRQNRLLNSGVRLLRFTAADVLRNPDTVVSQVRAMLAA